ncbi:MAG: hypothetical protein PHX38_02095 [Sulfuricella sp.]|nr:hypothetical protein [Sulfuricella sp.]
MNGENGAYRWWENYLVRYLMPSIAGAVIVNWLVAAGHPCVRNLLLLEVGNQGLQTPTLALLFLYGNLFCYISSYPILGFHVTRVVDFERGAWHHCVWDGYVSTLLIAFVIFLLSVVTIESSRVNPVVPFAIALVFVGLQLYRINLALREVAFNGLTDPVSKVFAYTFALSRRRGVVEESSITKQSAKGQEDQETGDKFDEEAEWRKRSVWRRELIDTYRHMREHGNSAFIFVLELTLAGLCYLLLVAYKAENASYQLAALGVLFALWALPAMFIHLVGQHIERRFSLYDRKVNPHPPHS